MGTPDFALKSLESINQYFNVSLVVTQPDKPTGRKKEIIFSVGTVALGYKNSDMAVLLGRVRSSSMPWFLTILRSQMKLGSTSTPLSTKSHLGQRF